MANPRAVAWRARGAEVVCRASRDLFEFGVVRHRFPPSSAACGLCVGFWVMRLPGCCRSNSRDSASSRAVRILTDIFAAVLYAFLHGVTHHNPDRRGECTTAKTTTSPQQAEPDFAHVAAGTAAEMESIHGVRCRLWHCVMHRPDVGLTARIDSPRAETVERSVSRIVTALGWVCLGLFVWMACILVLL